MEFTAEQQTFIDGLIKDSYPKAYAKAGESAKADIANAVAQAEVKYKADLAAATKRSEDLETALKSKGAVDDSAVTARIAAIEQELNQARESAVKGQLESITAKLNAVNPEQAAILLKMNTKTDDKGNLTVVNAKGEPRANADNKPMTVEEWAKEFLDANPHFVKAAGSQGAGSTGSTGSNTGAAKTMKRGDYDSLSSQAKSDFIKSGGKPVD